MEPASNDAPRRTSMPAEHHWALEVARPFGIPVRIHFTFVLLLLFVGYEAWQGGENPALAALFVMLIFLCVALHELGHAMVARRYGVKTRDIVLYPIGGVASLDRIPSGLAELWIALAGPAVNVVIAALLFGFVSFFGGDVLESPTSVLRPGALLAQLLVTNVLLVLFNLLPAFPMDGGRVLRALLSLRLGNARATAIAARVGQAAAILFGAVGLFGNRPMLIFIAFFVFLGAGQELALERNRALVSGRTARDAMITHFEALQPQDSLDKATQLLLASHQHDFPVVDAWGRVAGLLPRPLLLEGLARLGKAGAVLEVMRRDPPQVAPEAPLEEVLRALQQDGGGPLLVLEDGKLLGMITLENLSELLEVSQRLRPEGS